MTTTLQKDGLCRLLYTSAVFDGLHDVIDADEIARLAADRNAQRSVTGFLLLIDGQFFQILEGITQDVETTFEKICGDFRHDNLHLVDIVTVKDRIFPDWNMACLAPDQEARITLREELDEIRFLVNVNAGQAVRQMRDLLDLQLQPA